LRLYAKCRALGARVILEGDSIADAALAARVYVENEGMAYINGFDDFNIIAGAGSVGLEILEDVKNCDAIVVPVGGGGLIAGIALAVKTINPNVLIVGRGLLSFRCQLNLSCSVHRVTPLNS
jgi:threonine dehydratase